MLQNDDSDHIAELRAANPGIRLFGHGTGTELEYREDYYNHPYNVKMRSASLTWALTQVGSTLTAGISSSTTTIPVAEVTKSGLTLFAVGDVFIIDNELFKVSRINGLSLTVRRGTYMGTPAAAHSSGARAACIVSTWPGAIAMDVTTNCPAADVGHGSEHWVDWNARYLQTDLDAVDWDGMYIDVMPPTISWTIGASTPPARSIDPDRSNRVITNYAALDVAWNTGMLASAAAARALVGEEPILFGNGWRGGVRALTDFNGGLFENFPDLTTTSEDWRRDVVRPSKSGEPSYLDWCAVRVPSHAVIVTKDPNPFGAEPDYSLMRFGLCTALMGDGYFMYTSSSGLGTAGLMWFDEYDNAGRGRGYLGQPLAAAHIVTPEKADVLSGDGDFATTTKYNTWTLATAGGGAATKTHDSGTIKVVVTANGSNERGVELSHTAAIVSGKTYRMTFRAKGSVPVASWAPATLFVNENHMGGSGCRIATEWRDYSSIVSIAQTGIGALELHMGSLPVGTYWFDDIELREVVPEVWTRDFEGGIAVVNSTNAAVSVDLGGTFRKIKGTQAPTINDGSLVTAVTLPPKDGLVLLVPDTTAPNTTSDAASVYIGNATINLSAKDPGSGVAATYYRLDGGSQAIGTRITVAADGAHALEFWSIDRSGNVEARRSVAFSVISATPSPIPPTSTDPFATAISIRTSATRVYLLRTFVLTGVLTPGLLHDPCIVEVRKPGSGRWSYSSLRLTYSTTVASGANWWYRYAPKVRGTYYFRARYLATADRLASVSRQIAVGVR
jgi:hypothetical protein